MRIGAGVHNIDHSKFAYKYSVWPRKWKTGLIGKSTFTDGVSLLLTIRFLELSKGTLVFSRSENLLGSVLLHGKIKKLGADVN
jgi:hypothetical protein